MLHKLLYILLYNMNMCSLFKLHLCTSYPPFPPAFQHNKNKSKNDISRLHPLVIRYPLLVTRYLQLTNMCTRKLCTKFTFDFDFRFNFGRQQCDPTIQVSTLIFSFSITSFICNNITWLWYRTNMQTKQTILYQICSYKVILSKAFPHIVSKYIHL